jgi:hypothetical protein
VHELSSFYSRLLQFGFIGLRQAVRLGNKDWADAEIALLHNIPSLLSEPNLERHGYFWFKERVHYIEWASASGRDEIKSHMLTYYEPIWRDMEPAVLRLLEGGEQPAGE